MRAARLEEFSGPGGLAIEEVAAPVPGPGQIRVRVKASALNRADLLQTMGLYPAPPGVPADIPSKIISHFLTKYSMSTAKNSNSSYIFAEIFDLLAYIVFVAGVVFFIRYFIINPFNVKGSSMFPTLQDGDFIIVDKITTNFGTFKRGDIIVFTPPGKAVPYVKRIIGIPGETVKIKNNVISICKTASSIASGEVNTTPGSCIHLNQPFFSGTVITDTKCGKDEFVVDK